MEIEWQRHGHNWIGTTAIGYPQFKAWQSDDPCDDHWCLEIRWSDDEEPIKIGALQSPEAVEEIAEGFLMELEQSEAAEKGEHCSSAFGHFLRGKWVAGF